MNFSLPRVAMHYLVSCRIWHSHSLLNILLLWCCMIDVIFFTKTPVVLIDCSLSRLFVLLYFFLCYFICTIFLLLTGKISCIVFFSFATRSHLFCVVFTSTTFQLHFFLISLNYFLSSTTIILHRIHLHFTLITQFVCLLLPCRFHFPNWSYHYLFHALFN